MVESLVAETYFGVILFGFVHGLTPGHGWPLAAMLAFKQKNKFSYGFMASLILSMAHFLSSMAVVAVYYVANEFVDFESPIFRYIVAGVLFILAWRFYTQGVHSHGPEEKVKTKDGTELTHDEMHAYGLEHDDAAEGKDAGNRSFLDRIRGKGKDKGHSHSHGRADPTKVTSLRSLAVFALILGFAHEEEFALLAIAIGGINPLLLMTSYATAVTISLVGVTLAAVKAYTMVEEKIAKHEHWIPKISGILLAALAIMFLVGVF
ncbi:MAG: hypothetical protein ACE5KG_05925 [Nitrososphaerales archaeon]